VKIDLLSSLRRVAFAVAGVAVLATSSAQVVTYAHDPYFEHPMELSWAFGLERIGLRLAVADALGDDYGEYDEELEKMLTRDFGRFGASLAQRDAQLAAELRDALEEVIEAFEEGDAADAIAEAQELLDRAYAALIPEELRGSPSFIGGVLADLLLFDDGVAEAYEDAADGDLWEYPTGWAALNRVEDLWAEVEGMATDERREDVLEMFEFLRTVVYPDVRPPPEIRGDPEEAEGATHRITGILEEVTDAYLYASRDLGRLAGALRDTAAPGCAAYAAGDEALGTEHMYFVRDPYRKHLRRLLDLIAPDVHADIAMITDGLVNRGPAPETPPSEACQLLLDRLEEAQGLL
jgi:hypothetical protein